MKILVIDNGKLPYEQSEQIKVVQFKKAKPDASSFDSWLISKLTIELTTYKCSLVVLPFSLSEENYADLSGLKAAAFIRLMKEDTSRIPLLFSGPETLETVSVLSEYSTLLLTPRVFIENNLLTNDSLLSWYENSLGTQESYMTDKQYERFLTQFTVTPPSKYDSRHAIANEWAVHRWADMLNIPFESEMENQLFYRYMRAKLKESQAFNAKWRKNNPSIGKITFRSEDRYRIVLIDDEYNKGWETVLREIIETKSGQELVVYDDFNSSYTKEELLKNIYRFVDSTPADCYIIDLRLHEDDSSASPDELSGHQLSEYLLHDKNNGNRGRKIILFTASNKAWNLEKEMQNVSAYVIKESPEQLLNRQESYSHFAKFTNAIKDACAQSYISKLVEMTKRSGVSGLEGFIDALVFDKSVSKEQSLKMLLLLMVFFIEDYVKDRYMFTDYIEPFPKFTLNEKNGTKKYVIEKKLKRLKHVDNSVYNKNTKEYLFIDEESPENESQYEWAKPQKTTKDNSVEDFSTTLIVCTLKYVFNISYSAINKFMACVRERNLVVHENADCRLTITDIVDIIDCIIKPILQYHISNKPESR